MLVFPLGMLAPSGSVWKILIAPLNSLFVGVVIGTFIAWRLQKRRKPNATALVAGALLLTLQATAQVPQVSNSRESKVGIPARMTDLDAGPHDRRAFLWREQGSHVAALPEIQVEVRSRLTTLLEATPAWSASQRVQTESA
jgi:hypothetical protein